MSELNGQAYHPEVPMEDGMTWRLLQDAEVQAIQAKTAHCPCDACLHPPARVVKWWAIGMGLLVGSLLALVWGWL